jgi:hypothetical protein
LPRRFRFSTANRDLAEIWKGADFRRNFSGFSSTAKIAELPYGAHGPRTFSFAKFASTLAAIPLASVRVAAKPPWSMALSLIPVAIY